eukprot:SM000037S13494  [mRNA]  locus=s37:192110:197390:+ [translate_table: standard]
MVVDEKSWVTYPHMRSVLTIPFFSKLRYEITTICLDDDGSSENVHKLPPAELERRKVDRFDIASDKVARPDYVRALDPALFHSQKTGRGPLRPGWQSHTKPLMCAYKLVKAQANYWGVQRRAEGFMISGLRSLFLLTHRNAFCYIDEWWNLTYDQIMELEMGERAALCKRVKQPKLVIPIDGLAVEEQVQKDEWASDDDEDLDVEFFEAEAEWAAQEQELLEGTIAGGEGSTYPGRGLAPTHCPACQELRQPKDGETWRPPSVYCEACQEYFCQGCYAQIHVTMRMRQHRLKYLVPTSSAQSSTSLRALLPISLENRGALEAAAALVPIEQTGSRESTDLVEKKGLTSTESFASQPVELSAELVATMLDIYKKLLPSDRSPAQKASSLDPYGSRSEVAIGSIGPYGKLTEISSMGDKASSSVVAKERLVEQLVHVVPQVLTHEERLAFWINIYNALLMQAYIEQGIPGSHYKRVNLMAKATYSIGGLTFNALQIEHAVLRACSSRPALAGLLLVHKFKNSDERLACALDRPEPLVSFALCSGCRSAPAVRLYSASNISNELQQSARDYLQAAIGLSKSGRILVPKILHWYARDFSDDAFSLLSWIFARLQPSQQKVLQEKMPKRPKDASRSMLVVPYDWNFRYLL